MNVELKNIASKEYRFIISGGGTGGHLFPAIAIADKLREIFPDCGILFVGAKGKMEMEKVPPLGYQIIGLNIGGMQRKKIWRNLKLPFMILSSLSDSGKIIRQIQPHAVIGTGGYASFPLLWKSSHKHICSIIQEQNFYPGVTNRILAKYVDKICVIDEQLKKYFPVPKVVVTGNPVRENLANFISTTDEFYSEFNLQPGKFTVLVTGGSLGARTINEGMISACEKLLGEGIQVIWQTGKYYFNEISGRVNPDLKTGLCLRPFIDQMEKAYAVSNLVVCRAGAITLSELAILKKAAVLIPSPNVAEDHQTKNAMSLVDKKAALMIHDSETVKVLGDAILGLYRNSSLLNELSENIGKLAQPDSTKLIVNEIIKLIKRV